jgi:Leucine-rich repeat (LRR) protein
VRGDAGEITELEIFRCPRFKEVWAELVPHVGEGKLKKLQRLCLNDNLLTELPPEIPQMTTLHYLDLGKNRLTELPDSLGQMQALKNLWLQSNRLTALPDSLSQLQALERLYLGGNRLTALPESLGQLGALKKLYLGGNRLTALPESLGQLGALERLELNGNQLRALPERLGQLGALKVLELNGNQLTALPERLGQLGALKSLELQGNQLTALPENFGQLQALQELYLHENQLRALPDSLGQMGALKRLLLWGNPLRALPGSCRNLATTLTLLSLGDCANLLERGEGDTLGRRELRACFGDRVVLPQEAPQGPLIPVTKEAVYARLDAQTPHINRRTLAACLPPSLHILPLSPEEAVALGERMAAFVGAHGDSQTLWGASSLDTAGDLATLVERVQGYIAHLFGASTPHPRPWMAPNAAVRAHQQRLVSGVLRHVAEQVEDIQKLETEGDKAGAAAKRHDLLALVIPVCQGIVHCPEGQTANFDYVQAALQGQALVLDGEEGEAFEKAIGEALALWKQEIFRLTFAPGAGSQNVHVLGFWWTRLQDELGLGPSPQSTSLGTMGRDPFLGHEGNALQAFYQKLTPGALIRWVKAFVNDKPAHVNACVAYLIHRQRLPEGTREVLLSAGPIPGESLSAEAREAREAREAFRETSRVAEAFFVLAQGPYGDVFMARLKPEGAQAILTLLELLAAPEDLAPDPAPDPAPGPQAGDS